MSSDNISTANLISSNSPLYRFPNTKNPYVAAAVFESLLYGAYFCFGCISTYLLIIRRIKLNPVILCSAIILFWLATADVIYTNFLLFRHILEGSITFKQLYPKYFLYVLCNTIADFILLYRCYVIWEYNRLIVAGPAMLLIATTGSGIIIEGTNSGLVDWSFIYLSMTVAFNMLVTSLTAGRIWWIRRHAKSIRNVELAAYCKRTVAFLIESGCIYTFYIFVDIVFHMNQTVNAILDAGLIQVVAIMPTLIMIYAGLQSQHISPSSPEAASPRRPLMQNDDYSYTPLQSASGTTPRSPYYRRPSIDLSYEIPMPAVYTR